MVKNIMKRCIAMIIAVILTVSMLSFQLFTVGAVVPSKVDYRVFLNGTKIFIHNDKSLSTKTGTEYYFTYTVESAVKKSAINGIIVTADASRNFPYMEGGFMRYQPKESVLLDEGSTYFVKVTVASGGFRYDITRAKDDTLERIVLEKTVGDATDKVKYTGLWLYDSNTEATLSNFRFYDEYGNDLGVKAECGSGTAEVIDQNLNLKKATDIDHRYDITVDNKYNIAISNTKPATASSIYIQYTVESAEYTLNQTGIALSNNPKENYPHGKGILKYIQYAEDTNSVALLEPGCDYVIKIDREESDYKVVVQKTKGKNTQIFIISRLSGTYKKDYESISLWFGTGERRATLHLTDFLIYDENRNNLGVQTNVDSTIRHTGELEDYAGCEAAYYCKENNGFIALYKDKTMVLTLDSASQKANYTVSKNVLTAHFSSGRETYEYLFRRITDSADNVYERLYTYKVQFITGNDTEIPEQVLSNETGYQVARPTDPQISGRKFEGWVTSDDKQFDFNQVVVKSMTLYAKWSGDEAVFAAADWSGSSLLNYGVLACAIIVLLAGALVGVIFIRKGLKK
ncbi:MAG: InlB B-repeat-containing protein [Clostridia bacterium]|nr:InlB B-repeat-containing protein [Clostridia bacterium]